jgi:hypothetical protein
MRVGTVCYATEQGLGCLAKSFFDAGIIQEAIIIPHRHNRNHPEWYGSHAIVNPSWQLSDPQIYPLLSRLDVMLFFETPFDWSFPAECRARGVKTVLMPMYEWHPDDPKYRNQFDLYLCPSLLDIDYFSPHSKTAFFVPPADPTTWTLRTHARRYLHNAGHGGSRWHKGTLELLRAVPLLRPEIRLTIRCQETGQLNKMLSHVPSLYDDSRVEFVTGTIPYSELFSGSHDVYVAPEKYNGLSLPLQEAFAAGLLVMASDRYPANTWLPKEPLIPVSGYHRAAVGSGYYSFDEAEITPESVATTMNGWYDRDISDFSRMGHDWAEAYSWTNQKQALLRILDDLCHQ